MLEYSLHDFQNFCISFNYALKTKTKILLRDFWVNLSWLGYKLKK